MQLNYRANRNNQSPVRPILLTVSGNDCYGMAGAATDIRTANAMNVHVLPVITANTAQNNQGVQALNPIPVAALQSQLESALMAFPDAIKIGQLANDEQIECVASALQEHTADNVIYDPVLKASSGEWLHQAGANADSEQQLLATIVAHLYPCVSLITPNIAEASWLSGIEINSLDDFPIAAQRILSMGAKAVYISGGHLPEVSNGEKWCHDFFLSQQHSFWLASKAIASINTRGTGCALSSAIAAALALGASLQDAVVIGKMAVHQGIRYGYGIEQDAGPVAIQRFPDDALDLPLVSDQRIRTPLHRFPRLTHKGLYPIVDRAQWVARLAPLGIKVIQLRIKDLTGAELKQELREAIKLGRQHQCLIFVNDYWQLAIELDADGIHLGQDDLQDADIEQIANANLMLGISTHCHYEVARAHGYQPSYIALGPVFETTTKVMPWRPLGIDGLSYWRKVLPRPIVAIGGINQTQLAAVHDTGAELVAMISALTDARDPEKVVRAMQALLTQPQSTSATPDE
ncbi:MAG: thiamine phosphate synthase [Gammaproteobacteria bacterium]|nr:thiamine phosphate synthase [Gammaproteobacteria bacterium]NVK86967.1 thiamine phosphate synthase [Gammaproteobacteria bacterium]